MRGVRLLQAGLGEVERVRVLHQEPAAAQQPAARPGLVAVLGLDLEQDQRVVPVRAAQVPGEQREQLLVGGRQQVPGAASVGEPEDVLAVLVEAAAALVRLAGQQGREGDLLRAERDHLLPDHPGDLVEHQLAQRQPQVPAGRHPPDVPGPGQQPVARRFGVRGVFA